MTLLAVIDATQLRAPQSSATLIAGLSLLERTLRLAHVCGADHTILIHDDDDPTARKLIKSPPFGASVESAHSATIASPVDVLFLRGDVVFERALIRRSVDALQNQQITEAQRHRSSHFAILPHQSHAELQHLLTSPRARIQAAPPRLDGGWTVQIDSPEAVQTASRRLFNGCRKPQDGIVSRHLNRHISISISRLLAPTAVKPNHISGLTLALGVTAAVAAAFGGYLGFLLAGLLYQINSIIDGVDGELARVRYEFSVTGEWLDTISDDMADLLIYIGLGIGAFRTMPDPPGPFGPETWLVLGFVAALAKIASMIVYYRWLIAHKRGDLLAFDWSFNDDNKPRTGLARALSATHFLFRKDFIVFVAMILAIVGYLPHLLFVLAPGNLIVAVSVIIQNSRNQR